MKKTIYRCSMFVVFFLSLPILAGAQNIITKDTAYRLYNESQYVESYTQYMYLLREDPVDVEVNLGLARAAMAAGKYTQAALAYERLVQCFPKDASLHMGLSQVYTTLGNTEAALLHMQEAQRLAPKTSIVETDDRSLTKPERSPWSIHGRVGAGVIYDSNYVLGPPRSDITVGDYEVRIRKEGVKDDAWGSYLRANVNMSYRLEPRGPWWIIGDVGAYQKWYFGNADDLTWGRAAVGVYYGHPKFWWSLRVKGENTRQDMDDAVSTIGTEATFTYLLSPRMHLMTRAEYGYLDDVLVSSRSGAYIWIGEYLKMLSADQKIEFLLGGKVFHYDAKSQYEHRGWEISGQVKYALPWESDLSFYAIWREKRYDGPATSWLDMKRKDERLLLGTALTQYIDEAWSVDLQYQYMDNNSNTNWSDYRQHVVSMGLTWSF